MASKTLGRVVCPVQCGHQAAQVKLKTDKASGTAHPYVHCAGCGLQLHTRNEEQAGHLLRITRAEKGADVQEAPKVQPNKENAVETPKNAPAGLFSGIFAPLGGAA